MRACRSNVSVALLIATLLAGLSLIVEQAIAPNLGHDLARLINASSCIANHGPFIRHNCFPTADHADHVCDQQRTSDLCICLFEQTCDLVALPRLSHYPCAELRSRAPGLRDFTTVGLCNARYAFAWRESTTDREKGLSDWTETRPRFIVPSHRLS